MKIKGPLLSLGAHGSIADILTFSKKRTGQQARKYNKPTGVPSGSQRSRRRLTEFLVAQWQNMTTAQKATWETNAKASDKRLSGYHFFLRSAQRDLYTHTGLCAYWPMNELSGNQILDLSGNTNHGTLKPTYPNDVPTRTTSVKTQYGNALLFDGVNNQVDCGNKASINIFNTDTWYVEWWAKVDPTGDAIHDFFICHIIRPRCMTEIANRNFALNGNVGAAYKVLVTTGNNAFPWNTWTCFGVGADTTHFRLLINGAVVASDTFQVIDPAFDNFFIGKPSWGNEGYKGKLDEFCIYNRFPPIAEIKARYDFVKNKV